MSNIISFDELFNQAVKVPGVRIDRKEFLLNNFSREFEPEIVNKIVDTSPIRAGVDKRVLNEIAKECISFERYKVSAISAGTGFGGAATIPADLIQYLAHVLRVSQKLAYTYGWPELISLEKGLDETTKNILLLFIGRMFGVRGTNKLIQALSEELAKKVVKDLSKAALTKTALYPLIKEMAKAVGVKITKKVFADSIGKSIPVIASIISGALTYHNFGSGADKLHESLREKPYK